MIRFLHTSDWQLGMTRHFLGADAQARFSQTRFDAIGRLGQVSAAERCDLVLVCGDVFESNQVDRKTVSRAFEALASVPVPVYLLPGNHDCLDSASVYRSPTFTQRRPANVHVLDDAVPRVFKTGVEILGVPWKSKRPLSDLVADACGGLERKVGVIRICVAHGMVDRLSPDHDNPSLIDLARVEDSLAQGRIHYLALGDRHSATKVDHGGRVWYSGSPEPTDYGEEDPGRVLVVEIDAGHVAVTPHPIGTWRFERQRFDVSSDADLGALEVWLQSAESKDRTILKLVLAGTLTLRNAARLEAILEDAKEVFAAIEDPERHRDIAIVPDDEDFSGLAVSGFARAALDSLRTQATAGGAEAAAARGALGLMLRLVQGSSP